jgi:hypothetical protein
VGSIPATSKPGKCAFLAHDNRCSIYEHRPAVCRSFGMPIKWTEGRTEARDICELNEAAFPDVTVLRGSACWDMDKEDAALRRLQLRDQGAEPDAVAAHRGYSFADSRTSSVAANRDSSGACVRTITLDELHADMVGPSHQPA